ncbi:hypothetical protein Y032_0764g2151 [Ancylostoma ceylanicum]|nr:hypothetical protein Y032_0764g2151 [Ancylostoma ceylanicum]
MVIRSGYLFLHFCLRFSAEIMGILAKHADIVKAESQVVAGVRYIFEVLFGESTCKKGENGCIESLKLLETKEA